MCSDYVHVHGVKQQVKGCNQAQPGQVRVLAFTLARKNRKGSESSFYCIVQTCRISTQQKSIEKGVKVPLLIGLLIERVLICQWPLVEEAVDASWDMTVCYEKQVTVTYSSGSIPGSWLSRRLLYNLAKEMRFSTSLPHFALIPDEIITVVKDATIYTHWLTFIWRQSGSETGCHIMSSSCHFN